MAATLGGTTAFGYDPHDRVTDVAAPNGADTRYEYDDLGDLRQEVSPDRGTITRTYDAAGNVLTVTDARGVTATYAYDARNRVTAIRYTPSASGDAGAAWEERLRHLLGTPTRTDEDVTLTYDQGPVGIGRLCRVQDASGTTQYSYDAFGEVTQERHTELGVAYATGYAYDPAGRILSITYPDGRVVAYTRDGVGRITSVTATVNGAPVPITSARTYRADGLLTSQTFGNGLVESRSYDLQGRLLEQFVGSADTRVYGYDANGNVTSLATLPEVSAYAYDAVAELTNETVTGVPSPRSTGYPYDANGNRLGTTRETVTTPYAYGAQSNRLLQAGHERFTLDAAGNTIADRERQYRYNDAGELSRVERGGLSSTYVYDARGRRTQKRTTRGLTVYHDDLAGHLILETREDGATIRAYVYAGNTPIAQIDGRADHGRGDRDEGPVDNHGRAPSPGGDRERLSYLHTDATGTPRLATDSTQHVVWRWTEDAFGAQPAPDGDAGTDRNGTGTDRNDTVGPAVTINLRFPGQYYDRETGLYYNGARYYDPGIGRYVSSDPIGLNGGLNTYLYAAANPSRFIDPSGLDWIYTFGIGGSSSSLLSPPGGSGNGSQCLGDPDKCEQQAQADETICRGLSDAGARARCWASANERYGACRANRPLPPLVTWKSSAPEPNPAPTPTPNPGPEPIVPIIPVDPIPVFPPIRVPVPIFVP